MRTRQAPLLTLDRLYRRGVGRLHAGCDCGAKHPRPIGTGRVLAVLIWIGSLLLVCGFAAAAFGQLSAALAVLPLAVRAKSCSACSARDLLHALTRLRIARSRHELSVQARLCGLHTEKLRELQAILRGRANG